MKNFANLFRKRFSFKAIRTKMKIIILITKAIVLLLQIIVCLQDQLPYHKTTVLLWDDSNAKASASLIRPCIRPRSRAAKRDAGWLSPPARNRGRTVIVTPLPLPEAKPLPCSSIKPMATCEMVGQPHYMSYHHPSYTHAKLLPAEQHVITETVWKRSLQIPMCAAFGNFAMSKF